MRWLLLLALAGACETRSSAPQTASSNDAGCVPMPSQCETGAACVVSTDPDGARVCSGETCCQDFCALNGCTRCCKNGPSP